MIETLTITFHVLGALAIVGLVLIQQGKGAEMGAGFGAGASSTVFGSQGAGSFLTRLTTGLAIVFFMTSFGLAFYAKERSQALRDLGIPQITDEISAEVEEAPTGISISPDMLNSEVPQVQVIRPEGPDGPAYNVQISTSVQPAEPAPAEADAAEAGEESTDSEAMPADAMSEPTDSEASQEASESDAVSDPEGS